MHVDEFNLMPIISVDECGKIGLVRDAYSQELVPNAWTNAKNFRFREGYAEKVLGHTAVYSTVQVPIHHLLNVLLANGSTWVYSGLQRIYAVDPNFIHTDITRESGEYTGGVTNKWTGGVLSGIVILNNGVDVPQFWPGTGKCQDLTAWPEGTLCKVLRPFRNYLIALNVTKGANKYPHLIKWSHAADPGTVPSTWDQTDTTKEAGEYDLADEETELVDGLTLGEQFIAYKRSGFYSVQYIGAPFIFRFQKISSLFGGALAANCVTSFPAGHFVLGPGDVYVHQGTAPESVIDTKNRKWLFRQLDGDNQARAFTTISPVSNELWVCFPQVGDEYCTLALVWNWKENTWGVRELPEVLHAASGSVNFVQGQTWSSINSEWDAQEAGWDQNVNSSSIVNTLMGGPNLSNLMAIDLGTRFDSAAFDSYVERDNIRFDDPRTVKLLKQVRPLIEGPFGNTINVYVGTSYDQTASPVWEGPFPFRIGIDQYIDCHVTGRMLGVRFQAEGDFTWRLKRYDVEVEVLGMF